MEPWKAEIEFTTNELRSVLIQQAEHLFPAGVPDVRPYGEGYSQLVYTVGPNYVLRVPKQQTAKQNLLNGIRMDQWLQSRLRSCPLPTSQIVWMSDEPIMMALVTKIQGQTPAVTPESIRGESAEQLAIFLRWLHDQSADELRDYGVEKPSYIRMERNHLIKGVSERYEFARQQQWFDQVQLAEIHHVIESFHNTAPLELMNVPLHGDVHPLNLLVDDDGRLTAIIDWDDAYIGHPAVDLSIVYSWIPENSRSLFWKCYGVIDEQTKQYARMTALYIGLHIHWSTMITNDAKREKLARQMITDCISGR